MRKWGFLVGWISVGYAVLIGALVGILVMVAGPPPNGEPLATNTAFYVATLLPLVALVGLILARTKVLLGIVILAASGVLLAVYSLLLVSEINPLMAFAGILMVVSAWLINAGNEGANA